jgi:hypothetical protein
MHKYTCQLCKKEEEEEEMPMAQSTSESYNEFENPLDRTVIQWLTSSDMTNRHRLVLPQRLLHSQEEEGILRGQRLRDLQQVQQVQQEHVPGHVNKH